MRIKKNKERKTMKKWNCLKWKKKEKKKIIMSENFIVN